MIKKFFLFVILLLLTACSSGMTARSAADSDTAPAAAAPMPAPATVPAVTASMPAAATAPAAADSASDSPQIANPASKNCIEKGGRLDIRQDAEGGQFGVCIFPNGKECEEWALMRGTCSPDDSTAKEPGTVSTYKNTSYGFDLNYPNTWSFEEIPATGETPLTLKFTRDQSVLMIQIKRAQEKTVFNADAPQGGEIVNQGTLSISGQQAPIQVVKLEGKVKSAAANISVNDLRFRFQLDSTADSEIPDDIFQEAEAIAASIQLK